MSVYFRFEGDESHIVPGVDVSIDRFLLEEGRGKVSLLSKLAIDRWKTNEAAGSTAEEPIVTKPLESPCRTEWDPKLAQMIADAYQYHRDSAQWARERRMANTDEAEEAKANTPPGMKLPHGVELEDALAVLDYYSIVDEGDDINIDYSEADDAVQLRGKLFLKWVTHSVPLAKRFILETLKKQDPQVSTFFLFASSDHDMEYINARKRAIHRKKPFVRVGTEDDCDQHFEWVKNYRLRQAFIASLEEESDLEASFVHMNYHVGDYEAVENHCPDPEQCSVDVCFVGRSYETCELMRVLEVTVPEAPMKYGRYIGY